MLPAALAAVAVVSLGATGCGSAESSDAPTGDAAAPEAKDFPAADGRTLEQIAGQASESDIVLAASSSVFHEGTNRVGFGAFTIDRKPISDVEIALYAARPNKPASGPYPAASESLAVEAPYQSKSTSTDPDAATNIYASEVEMKGKGEWRVLALIRDDSGNLSYSLLAPSPVVGAFPDVPKVGEKAPVIDTPTAEDVGGDLAKIDTRQPPSTMHEVDFADVVGKEPVVLLFATPALCQTRVCGPVVDIAEQVKDGRPDDAAFIHMEIYKDNVVGEDNLRPQVESFGLPSEPWLFVIDEDGRISTEIEGAFSEGELDAALDKVS